MSELAISAEALSKAYRIWHSPRGRLAAACLQGFSQVVPAARRRLSAWEGRYYHEFHALRDVSFNVRKGEAVGIVGRNGSGKSTLLQIIAGTLAPTSGSVNVTGKVAALLELGSGFNPEYTGRENVYLNASLFGLTEEMIHARFDRIAAFADIGEFIEQPVKTYSSGMVVRLAFAVAAHVEADILIIDEALSVGDARFQMKCARAIDRFRDAGTTLLFVSHDANAVNRLCTAAILLDAGRVRLVHAPRVVTNIYLKMTLSEQGIASVESDLREAQTQPLAAAPTGASEIDDRPAKNSSAPLHDSRLQESENLVVPKLSEREYVIGGDSARIMEIDLRDEQGEQKRAFHTSELIKVTAKIEARIYIPSPIFALRIRSAKGVDVYGTNTHYMRCQNKELLPRDVVLIEFTLEANMLQGDYFVSVGCSHFEQDQLVVHHRRYDALQFTVIQTDHAFGSTNCRARFSLQRSA